MKIFQFGDRVIFRFGSMEDKERTALTMEAKEKYDALLLTAQSKKKQNDDNKDVADYSPVKLNLKEKAILIADNFAVRYLLAILYPVIVGLILRNQQPQEPIEDEDEDEDEDFDTMSKSDKRQLIKKLRKSL